MPHFDLSAEAFQLLAPNALGAIYTTFRSVSCDVGNGGITGLAGPVATYGPLSSPDAAAQAAQVISAPTFASPGPAARNIASAEPERTALD